MNQLFDEQEVHELVRLVKSEDARHVSSFESVLERSSPQPRRSANSAILCVIVLFGGLIVALLVWSGRADHDRVLVVSGRSSPPTNVLKEVRESPQLDSGVNIDFDHLRRVVQEHFDTGGATSQRVGDNVWSSSRTESLLTLNLTSSQPQE